MHCEIHLCKTSQSNRETVVAAPLFVSPFFSLFLSPLLIFPTSEPWSSGYFYSILGFLFPHQSSFANLIKCLDFCQVGRNTPRIHFWVSAVPSTVCFVIILSIISIHAIFQRESLPLSTCFLPLTSCLLPPLSLGNFRILYILWTFSSPRRRRRRRLLS